MNKETEEKSNPVLNKITVTFADPSILFTSPDNQEVYESRGSRILANPPRLQIFLADGVLYIMLDKVVSYFIS